MKIPSCAVLVFAASFVLLGSPASATSLGVVPDQGCLTASDGVFFCDNDLSSAGTGLIDPFLRTNGGGSFPVTSGWNTDSVKQDWTQFNDADGSHTDALAVGDINTMTIGGVTYWTFLVDVNQNGAFGTDLIDLTHLELFSCSTQTYTDLSGCTSFFNLFGGSVTYDSNNRPVISDTTWVTFDYRNHSGSGAGDILVFIPTTDSFPTTNYVAFLDGWGSPPGTNPDNDGFQEWINIGEPFVCQDCNPGSPVPEPTTLLLFGGGLALMARRLGKRKSQGL
jgi:PEP-CTERM motif-containing protein